MIIHHVQGTEEFENLYNDSALTMIGLSLDSLGEYADWINQNSGGFKGEPEFWIISGERMNEEYGTDYPEDLHIVCVKLSDLSDLGNLIIARFSVGARWFDDVVDNNSVDSRCFA